MPLINAAIYFPVAVTPQLTTKVAVELAGNNVRVIPVDCNAASVSGLGDTVIDAAGVAEKVTEVQSSPLVTGSLKTLPGASAGPRLATVTMYAVVLPAGKELTPLVLLMVSHAAGTTLLMLLETLLPVAVSVIKAETVASPTLVTVPTNVVVKSAVTE